MEDDIFFYCEDHSDADYSALAQRFGSPEDVAKNFQAELGGNAESKAVIAKQYVLFFFATVAITAIILAAGVEIYTNYKQRKALDGYFVESITYDSDVNAYITAPTYAVEYANSEDSMN